MYENVLDIPQMKQRGVVIVSGGIDSSVLLWHLASLGHELYALTFNYGQRHVKEVNKAAHLAAIKKIPWQVANIDQIQPLISNSSQTGSTPVPEGHYADENMKQTVVPNRNMIMLSIALGYAVNIKADFLAYAAHGGDHAIYPDCRQEFVEALAQTALLADWHKVHLIAPYLDDDKTAIVRLGQSLGVPFEITWSCYKGEEVHCGLCATCIERREAFYRSDVEDPTTYAVPLEQSFRRGGIKYESAV